MTTRKSNKYQNEKKKKIEDNMERFSYYVFTNKS
jgi:hypothetical protein